MFEFKAVIDKTLIGWLCDIFLFYTRHCAFTFTRHIHTEVDAIDWIHIDCSRLHEHGFVPLSAFSSCRVWSFVLPTKIGLSFHYPPSQLSTICVPASQYLKETSLLSHDSNTVTKKKTKFLFEFAICKYSYKWLVIEHFLAMKPIKFNR